MKHPSLIQLVPLCDPDRFQDIYLKYSQDSSHTLRAFLGEAPALSAKPLGEELLQAPMARLKIEIVKAEAGTSLYRPPGLVVRPLVVASAAGQDATPTTSEPAKEPAKAGPAPELLAGPLKRPESLTLAEAVHLSYWNEIKAVASFLRTPVSEKAQGLSVLVRCDKLVVEHLYQEMVRMAGLEPKLLEVGEDKGEGLMPQSMRQRQLSALKDLMKSLKDGHVLVIPHLDLLAGATDASLSPEGREIVELLYGASERLMLAFADRSLEVPEVLASRFAARLLITGLPRMITYADGREKLLGDALVTASEAARFSDYDPVGLYKNVAGLNPIGFRQAVAYAVKELASDEPVPVDKLYRAIRAFKAQTSANFEVPDVSFEQIGGYEQVKNSMIRVLQLMMGSFKLPNEQLRRELIPRGFIFYGPPGTGKTLFAKAIANRLNANIQIVSGPEVTDMYVGESERKVRELFAEARRNAPAVLVFDEFDAIATQRSSGPDGGTRAGNALVAQILTEMDGFRPDVPVLVIGTTNRLDMIDEALLRPSRFQAIAIDLPERTARQAIARVHAGHFKVDVSSALVDIIADATEGFNGDEIRSIFREACVGLHCQTPPIPVDARRLGILVGNIRATKESREAEVAARRQGGARTTRRNQENPSSSTRVSLTPPARNASAVPQITENSQPARGELPAAPPSPPAAIGKKEPVSILLTPPDPPSGAPGAPG